MSDFAFFQSDAMARWFSPTVVDLDLACLRPRGGQSSAGDRGPSWSSESEADSRRLLRRTLRMFIAPISDSHLRPLLFSLELLSSVTDRQCRQCREHVSVTTHCFLRQHTSLISSQLCPMDVMGISRVPVLRVPPATAFSFSHPIIEERRLYY